MLGLLLAVLVLAVAGALVTLGCRLDRRESATELRESLEDAEHLVDLILAAGLRRMHQISYRGGPNWKEW